MKKNTYVQFENSFFEKIINRKRMEMFKLVSRKIDISKIDDLLDIGTTNECDRPVLKLGAPATQCFQRQVRRGDLFRNSPSLERSR